MWLAAAAVHDLDLSRGLGLLEVNLRVYAAIQGLGCCPGGEYQRQ